MDDGLGPSDQAPDAGRRLAELAAAVAHSVELSTELAARIERLSAEIGPAVAALPDELTEVVKGLPDYLASMVADNIAGLPALAAGAAEATAARASEAAARAAAEAVNGSLDRRPAPDLSTALVSAVAATLDDFGTRMDRDLAAMGDRLEAMGDLLRQVVDAIADALPRRRGEPDALALLRQVAAETTGTPRPGDGAGSRR